MGSFCSCSFYFAFLTRLCAFSLSLYFLVVVVFCFVLLGSVLLLAHYLLSFYLSSFPFVVFAATIQLHSVDIFDIKTVIWDILSNLSVLLCFNQALLCSATRNKHTSMIRCHFTTCEIEFEDKSQFQPNLFLICMLSFSLSFSRNVLWDTFTASVSLVLKTHTCFIIWPIINDFPI